MKAIEQMSADELRAYAASLQAQVDKGTKKFTAVASEYQGNPTLSLSGNFRPFRLGFGKLLTILEHHEKIVAALVAAGDPRAVERYGAKLRKSA